MTTNDTFANKFFSATRAASLLEGKLVDQLIEIAEKRVDEPDDWDFDDIIFDDYDGSVEYRGASSSLVFTDEQAQKIFDLGFKRFWIVYTDGTERYYIPGHMTHKSSVIPRDCGKRRRDLDLEAQLVDAQKTIEVLRNELDQWRDALALLAARDTRLTAQVDGMKDTEQRRERWNEKAKDEWAGVDGYGLHRLVSFDKIWDECLLHKKHLAVLRTAVMKAAEFLGEGVDADDHALVNELRTVLIQTTPNDLTRSRR